MIGLDASAAAYLALAEARAMPSLATLSPAAARARNLDSYALDQMPQQPVGEVLERWCGAQRLKIWRGIDAPDRMAPALLYLHGGGWVIGAPETHEEICRRFANRAGAVVVAPHYGLAPESPFPSPVQDCAAALEYLHGNTSDLGIDPARIAVAGDSAGGNLAAVLALMARDGTVPPVSAQILLYPNTEQSQTGGSFRRFRQGFGLTAEEMQWFRMHYLTSADHYTDWRAAPLCVSSLAGVAPAIVVLAGQDVLYSEGAAYAERLEREARAMVRIWPGQIHGFISMSGRIPEGVEAAEWTCDAWRALNA